MNRRAFLSTNALLGLGVVTTAKAKSETVTPFEIEGPFYPTVVPADQDFDLTLIKGKSVRAKGEAVYVVGRVIDENGTAIKNATVDLWQANASGRYRHPFDTSKAPLDENFQGWAIVQSGEQGNFRFKTIVPGAYAVSQDWIRPPHIHFKVSKRGFVELTTQMYFAGEELNKIDRLLQRKSKKKQKAMIATQTGKKSTGEKIYTYNIVLKKV